jgi:Fe-S-cluster containining protein
MSINNEYVCDASCCRRFFLPAPPERLGELGCAIRKGEIEDRDDTLKISEMIIPIEESSDLENPGFWYTCKNLDQESGLCKIYDDRPEMCREYPYGYECVHCHSACGTAGNYLPAGGISASSIEEKVNAKD